MEQEFIESFELHPAPVQEQDKSAESAALIQKESVLVKLSARMKASETNLNLINRYLQKLSHSYRHQMDEMQIMFNATLKAMHLASEETKQIVLELRAFFLILEFIIISTFFSIFLNLFRLHKY
ncbi:hypothetical protein JTE90_013747 [Oedothorax gibbosus]|uniref:Uncharacterized protein n=1 Tax=Oedothorax gibbosus TaxID=931172 RepID=A0AAV6UYF0_9ARAC|nr:hypothetical protein JTE90_013747 [Oedothorax gibbosus]